LLPTVTDRSVGYHHQSSGAACVDSMLIIFTSSHKELADIIIPPPPKRFAQLSQLSRDCDATEGSKPSKERGSRRRARHDRARSPQQGVEQQLLVHRYSLAVRSCSLWIRRSACA